MITWDNLDDIIVIGLAAWFLLGLAVGIGLGKGIKAGQEPSDWREERLAEWRAAQGPRCCDGEFCGAWETCKESSGLG